MVGTNGRLVAGVHCSSRATRVVVCDADTGVVVRQSRASHTDTAAGPGDGGPAAWLRAFGEAAGGGVLEGVEAVGVCAQGHGVITLDAEGAVLAKPLPDEDISASGAAADLVETLGGAGAWAEAVGCVPGASTAVAQLRRLATFEPETAARAAAALMPHDWLTWQLLGCPQTATSDRSEASRTGYWSPHSGTWRADLVETAVGTVLTLPELVAPGEGAGVTPEGVTVSAGCSAEAATMLGLGLGAGDVVVAVGSSGATYVLHDRPVNDPSGAAGSYADATGRHLPLVRTLNAIRVLRSMATLLGRDADAFDALALAGTPGASGLVLLPYLDGERVPYLPHAAGTLTGLHSDCMTPETLARAAVEGMVCGLAESLDVLRAHGVAVERVVLTGAGARSAAVRSVAPMLFGLPVAVPDPGEVVGAAAVGVARQAAWVLSGKPEPPQWAVAELAVTEAGEGDLAVGQAVRDQFTDVRDRTHPEVSIREAAQAGRHRRG